MSGAMAGSGAAAPQAVPPTPAAAPAAMDRATLDRALCAAHLAGDGAALVGLYACAADGATAPGARAFYLTHAYVFALETGDVRAADLRARLRAMGCEH